MSKATEPRPHLIDRVRSAWQAFRDPNGAYMRPYLDGLRDSPQIVEGVVTLHSEPQLASGAPFYASPFSSAWPPDTTTPYFDYGPLCPQHFGCAGHVDNSTLTSHHTHWERFGPSGIVAVIENGSPAGVSLSDLPTERPYTPEHALLLAHEIAETARFTQQYALIAAMGAAGTGVLAKG